MYLIFLFFIIILRNYVYTFSSRYTDIALSRKNNSVYMASFDEYLDPHWELYAARDYRNNKQLLLDDVFDPYPGDIAGLIDGDDVMDCIVVTKEYRFEFINDNKRQSWFDANDLLNQTYPFVGIELNKFSRITNDIILIGGKIKRQNSPQWDAIIAMFQFKSKSIDSDSLKEWKFGDLFIGFNVFLLTSVSEGRSDCALSDVSAMENHYGNHLGFSANCGQCSLCQAKGSKCVTCANNTDICHDCIDCPECNAYCSNCVGSTRVEGQFRTYSKNFSMVTEQIIPLSFLFPSSLAIFGRLSFEKGIVWINSMSDPSRQLLSIDTITWTYNHVVVAGVFNGTLRSRTIQKGDVFHKRANEMTLFSLRLGSTDGMYRTSDDLKFMSYPDCLFRNPKLAFIDQNKSERFPFQVFLLVERKGNCGHMGTSEEYETDVMALSRYYVINNVEKVVIYPDGIIAGSHIFSGGILSLRTVDSIMIASGFSKVTFGEGSESNGNRDREFYNHSFVLTNTNQKGVHNEFREGVLWRIDLPSDKRTLLTGVCSGGYGMIGILLCCWILFVCVSLCVWFASTRKRKKKKSATRRKSGLRSSEGDHIRKEIELTSTISSKSLPKGTNINEHVHEDETKVEKPIEEESVSSPRLSEDIPKDLQKTENRDESSKPSQQHENQDNSGHNYGDVPIERNDTKNTFSLALSGGGIRAASFQLGTLEALSESPYVNVEQINNISSCNGASYTTSALTTHLQRSRSEHDEDCLAFREAIQRLKIKMQENSNYLLKSLWQNLLWLMIIPLCTIIRPMIILSFQFLIGVFIVRCVDYLQDFDFLLMGSMTDNDLKIPRFWIGIGFSRLHYCIMNQTFAISAFLNPYTYVWLGGPVLLLLLCWGLSWLFIARSSVGLSTLLNTCFPSRRFGRDSTDRYFFQQLEKNWYSLPMAITGFVLLVGFPFIYFEIIKTFAYFIGVWSISHRVSTVTALTTILLSNVVTLSISGSLLHAAKSFPVGSFFSADKILFTLSLVTIFLLGMLWTIPLSASIVYWLQKSPFNGVIFENPIEVHLLLGAVLFLFIVYPVGIQFFPNPLQKVYEGAVASSFFDPSFIDLRMNEISSTRKPQFSFTSTLHRSSQVNIDHEFRTAGDVFVIVPKKTPETKYISVKDTMAISSSHISLQKSLKWLMYLLSINMTKTIDNNVAIPLLEPLAKQFPDRIWIPLLWKKLFHLLWRLTGLFIAFCVVLPISVLSVYVWEGRFVNASDFWTFILSTLAVVIIFVSVCLMNWFTSSLASFQRFKGWMFAWNPLLSLTVIRDLCLLIDLPQYGIDLTLSDGEHKDDLGILPLLRNKDKHIICFYAGLDNEVKHKSLFKVLSLAKEQKYVENFEALVTQKPIEVHNEEDVESANVISTDGQEESPRSESSRAHPFLNITKKKKISRTIPSHSLVVKIQYSEHEYGYLCYATSSITGDESLELLLYALNNDDFPFSSLKDQFFSYSKFSAYRELGKHVAEETFEDFCRFLDTLTAQT